MVKGVINHPILDIPAYTFEEDDSYVECRRCEIVGLTEHQEKIVEEVRERGITIINVEKGLGKVKRATHEVVDLVYHEDEGNIAFEGTYEECQDWKSEQGFGYMVRPII